MRSGQPSRHFAPLSDLLPDHVAPERLYLEARRASLVPYVAVSKLLSDVLPVGAGICASTLRAHTLLVAEHAEAALRDERFCFIEGCPAQWRDLPIPEGRIVVGIDGGYVRSWTEKKTNFEVIVACSIISKRFAKKQQMQWTPRGAHLLLQARTRTLDGTLRSLFQSWYPGLANDNESDVSQAAAA